MKPFQTNSGPAQENAMTEIALALAMGFFSIMVLTMIFMGAGKQRADSVQSPRSPALLTIAPSTPSTGAHAANRAPEKTDDFFVIFYRGRYLDAALRPVDARTVAGRLKSPDQRVVLAMDPGLSVREAMEARNGFDLPNLTVAGLDKGWLRALADGRDTADER